jgi:predicted MFS family arabinose efflux permease
MFGIASQATLPQLVHGPGLGRANSVLEAADGGSLLAGPALAGALVARFGAAWGLVTNAMSFVVSGPLLRVFLPPLEPPPPGPADRENREDWRRGGWLTRQLMEPVRLVATDRLQRSLQLALMVLSAHGATLVLAALVLGQRQLGLSVAQIGFVLSAAGVGGLVVSLLAARYPSRLDRPQTLAVSLLLSCIMAGVLAGAQSFWWALVANGLLDGFITAAFIAAASVRQAHTPNEVMGRVGAASAVANNLARVVGAVGVGVLLSVFGGRVALAADALLLGLVGLGMLLTGQRR